MPAVTTHGLVSLSHLGPLLPAAPVWVAGSSCLETLLLAAAKFLQALTWLAGLALLLALLGYQGAAGTQACAEGHDLVGPCLQ